LFLVSNFVRLLDDCLHAYVVGSLMAVTALSNPFPGGLRRLLITSELRAILGKGNFTAL
jgi:hypothetical protein